MVTRVTETGVGIVDGTNHPNHITNILNPNPNELSTVADKATNKEI